MKNKDNEAKKQALKDISDSMVVPQGWNEYGEPKSRFLVTANYLKKSTKPSLNSIAIEDYKQSLSNQQNL